MAEHITSNHSSKNVRGMLLGHDLEIVCRVCKLSNVLRNAHDTSLRIILRTFVC